MPHRKLQSCSVYNALVVLQTNPKKLNPSMTCIRNFSSKKNKALLKNISNRNCRNKEWFILKAKTLKLFPTLPREDLSVKQRAYRKTKSYLNRVWRQQLNSRNATCLYFIIYQDYSLEQVSYWNNFKKVERILLNA